MNPRDGRCTGREPARPTGTLLITPIAKLQNGAPIYDGYLIEDTGTGPSASAALDQCAANLPADDPQRVLRGRSEPLFIVNSEHLYPRVGRPADSNTPDSRLWLWMVAGASHGWTWQYDYGDAALEDLIKAGFADSGGWSHFECGPDQPEVDLYMVEKKAYEYLHRWVLRGTPPPAASDPQVVDGQYVRDSDGNVIGGLRMPEMQVPVARYTGRSVPDADCMNVIAPFTAARLAQLYTSHGDYYAKYKKAVQEFRKEGFLFPEDAEKLLAKAAAVPIPG